MRDEEARHTPAPPPPVENKRYAAGLEVEIGEHRFRCLDVLGKGSYSEVWRGEVLKGGSGEKEVALKEVRCSSQVELQQAIFEVQVLLALERSASSSSHGRSRVPRCISYKVDPCNNGWKVRTSMTVVPGESLDVFIRHKVTPGVTRESATKRAVLLSAKLLRDISPTLQLLAPIAWHRDVNSHNILIDTVRNDSTDVHEIERLTSFWLIDFGLAVDSQSWVTMHGRWRQHV
jgi:serine/threonine protein kinase